MERVEHSDEHGSDGIAGPDVASLIEPVAELVMQVVDDIVVPRFGRLSDDEITTKDGAELTTSVDVDAERVLTEGIRSLTPDVPVVGEEASSSDPAVLDLLSSGGDVWLVDPLDGTTNFTEHSPNHGTIVGLRLEGVVVAAWSWNAATGALHLLGPGGVERRTTTERHRLEPLPDLDRDPRVVAKWWYLPPEQRAVAKANLDRIDTVAGPGSAASEYPLLLDGDIDGLLYGRTRAWDHAPGCAMVRRLGGVARRLDGNEYVPGVPGPGLLVARSAAAWERIHHDLGFG